MSTGNSEVKDSRETSGSSIQVGLVYGLLWGLFLGAVGLAINVWSLSPLTVDVAKFTLWQLDLSFGLRFDVISISLLLMVSLLGAVIGHYSLRYLAGEKRQSYFYRHLLFTLIAVCLLVTSSNLLMFFVMWLATSFGLHRLLVYYSDRPQAIVAARKKFVVSRIGDVFLVAAIGITYREFGTFQFNELFELARQAASDNSHNTSVLGLIGCLFVIGAMTKSVQFPFHFWLPETMETPTPVSALMHAGIINAGGFLMIRLSPLLEHATMAHLVLTVIGSVTAVFGSLVMVTQNDIKKKLAYSTISQMGMMMFACGIGAYSLALFHIIAHSFYKAHAFLSTGTLVNESKKIGFKMKAPSNVALFGATAAGLALLLVGVSLEDGRYFIYLAYLAVLFLGLFQTFGSAASYQYSKVRVAFTVAAALLVAASAVFSIEHTIESALSTLVPDGENSWGRGQTNLWIALVSYFVFAAGLWLSAHLTSAKTPFMRKLYMIFWNGGYYSAVTGQMLEYGILQKSIGENQQPKHVKSVEQLNA